MPTVIVRELRRTQLSLVGIGHRICAKLLAKVYRKHFPIEVCLFGLSRLSAMQIEVDSTLEYLIDEGLEHTVFLYI